MLCGALGLRKTSLADPWERWVRWELCCHPLVMHEISEPWLLVEDGVVVS